MPDARDMNELGDEEFRLELRAWIEATYPPDKRYLPRRPMPDEIRDWFMALSRKGWLAPVWPREYGGMGLSGAKHLIYVEELERHGCARLPDHAILMLGPLLIRWGTDEQRAEHLPRILSGERIWCQGYSEPNAGSDLASLRTEAARDGDHYVVNGQKIWTSFAHFSDYCLLLVRTDPDAPKHKGITALLVDMKTPGVTVRPLRQITGEADFNEVFFDNVRVPVANVLGEVNKGWQTAITTLMNERANLGGGMYIRFKRQPEMLIARARETHVNGKISAQDPITRQKLAQIYVDLEVFRHNANRALSKMSKYKVPGPEGSILKIYWSEMNQRLQQTTMETLGPSAQLFGTDNGDWVYSYLRCRANTIEAGTSEILRNIVAERVLGLPKSY